MILLKNIRRNEKYYSCDIFPEDSKKRGTLVVDPEKDEIIKYSLPEGYEYCTSHVQHARREIKRMYDANDVKEEIAIMWY